MYCHMHEKNKTCWLPQFSAGSFAKDFLIKEKVEGTPGEEDIVPFAPIESLG